MRKMFKAGVAYVFKSEQARKDFLEDDYEGLKDTYEVIKNGFTVLKVSPIGYVSEISVDGKTYTAKDFDASWNFMLLPCDRILFHAVQLVK